MINRAIADSKVLEFSYYKENEDELTTRRIEPYRLQNGPEGWYVESYDLKKDGVRHFKLERIKEAKLTDDALPSSAATPPVSHVQKPIRPRPSLTAEVGQDVRQVQDAPHRRPGPLGRGIG